MSYILDALRRADAERERGEVPGLQSQQHALLPDEESPARSRLLVWAVVALSLALAAVLAWNFFGRDTPAPRPMAEGTVVTPPPAAPPPPPTVLPSTVTAAPPPAAPTSAAAATAPAAPRPAPPATRRATARPAVAASGAGAEAADARRASTRIAPAASTARASGDGRVMAQSELPEPIRRELPKLSIGGASYSNDAASRMVIINGQVFHEGDKIAPGLELERIRLRSAVLSFKGYRYELNY